MNAVCAEAAERIEEPQEFVRESFCERYDLAASCGTQKKVAELIAHDANC